MSEYRPPRRPTPGRRPIKTPRVLCPSLRGGDFLRYALDSLSAQTHDWHLILLDTSDEGRAEAVFRTYPESFRRKCTFEHIGFHDDGGFAGGARCFDLWGGEDLACWLHDDDAFHPNRIAHAVDYLRAHPEIDVAFSAHVGFTDPPPNPKSRGAYVTPEMWGWKREDYRPVGMASAMMRETVLDFRVEEGYLSGMTDVLSHARWWAAGLGMASVPDSPHYFRRKHPTGDFANACTPISVKSDLGMSRLGHELFWTETAMMCEEFASMEREMKALHAEFNRPVWYVRPGWYEVDGIGLIGMDER